MATLRARLTFAYGFALVGNVILFAGALYFAHNARGLQLRQLSRVAADQGERTLFLIRAAAREGRTLTERRPCPNIGDVRGEPTRRDSSGQVASISSAARRQCVLATADLVDLLDRVPGYYIVYDKDDRQIYSSVGIRQLLDQDRVAIDSAAVHLVTGAEGSVIPISDQSLGGGLLMASRPDSALRFISRLVAGVPTSLMELSPSVLTGTMLVIFPFLILASIGVSYAIAGNAVAPMETLINEVEAITDGRSLHRRLPSDLGAEELSRLGSTLNAMIGRLETSFGALRRFTADASHELKTPLTVLRADVERAMHPNAASGEKLLALEEALQETARMSDLVDSLLTLARADEGRFDLHREPVALEPLVRDVYETAVILGEDAGQTVTLKVIEEASVDGDMRRLRQLFLNLITNAIKYTPRGGKVELSLSRLVGDEVAFTVRDSGIGIAAADLDHVFERFFRADRARSRLGSRSGFGLGLSISQWIAQAHGGRITAQSRLGRGSTFIVTLPLLK